MGSEWVTISFMIEFVVCKSDDTFRLLTYWFEFAVAKLIMLVLLSPLKKHVGLNQGH